MTSPSKGLPYTREACLRQLGLDPARGDPYTKEELASAKRRALLSCHPDTGGDGACRETLNAVVHAHNILSSGPGARAASGIGYGNQWGGYARAAGEEDPMGLWRFRTLGARRFAGNVRLGLVVAGLATAGTLTYARSTSERRKKERSPRLRAAMNLRQEDDPRR